MTVKKEKPIKVSPLSHPEVEMWDVEKLIPYTRNVKDHPKEQVDKIANAIRIEKFRNPIHIDEDGVIIAGHGRRLAVMQLGFKKVPVIVERGLTEAQKDAMRISDNMTGRGGFDELMLGEEVMRLSGLDDFDLSAFGMDDDEISGIFQKLSDEDLEGLETIGSIDDENDDVVKEESVGKHGEGVEYKPSYAIVVECSGESEQRELYESLTADGRKCKIQTM